MRRPSLLIPPSLFLATLAGCIESPEAAAPADLGAETDTMLASLAALDELVQHFQLTSAAAASFDQIAVLVNDVVILADDLRADTREPLSRKAGQLAPKLRQLKRAVLASPLTAHDQEQLLLGIRRVQLSVKALNESVAVRGFHVIDRGHIDAVDAAYEDGALGITIHDETVDPDVERDPAHVILVAKSAARWEVPDARFAFLGPVGSDVWVLPENQIDAEAAGILWPGLSTEEIEAGTFLDDSVEIRFEQVLGPNGLSLFQSPEDELAPPAVVVDSENGLPDAIAVSAGTHKHFNWAFESPGVYLIRVSVRGRLDGVAGNPWVSSSTETLKFVVIP